MRIVAGRLKGRRLLAPEGVRTRPTAARVRESLFSSLTSLLGHDLGGGPVLDAFAGSGALGLEALSRGAGPVTFIERDRNACAALEANIASLGVGEHSRVVRGDVFSLVERRFPAAFALILLDPPYTLDAARIKHLLSLLAGTGSVAERAVVCWEHATDVLVEWPIGFEPLVSKRYGSTTVDMVRFHPTTGGQ
jgi:16S rRNA (guanine966-N2)-methyltransferase